MTEIHTLWIFAGWLRVSFGNFEPSAKTWDESPSEEPQVGGDVVIWAWRSSSVREVSPSTKWRESTFDIGRASGASVSNKILSKGT